MLARCYRCQNTFSTDRFGVQNCPSCGGEIYLPEPKPAPAEAPPAEAGPEGPPPQPSGPAAPAPAGGEPGAAPPILPPGLGGPGWGPPPPGWAPPSGGPGTGWAPLPPGVVPGAAEQSAPFVERARRGFVASFVETWKLAALDPVRFFRQVRVTETSSAVLFGVIAFTLGTWVSLVFRHLTASATFGFVAQLSRRMGNGRLESIPGFEMMQQSTAGSFVAQLVITPLLGLAILYVTAGIVHVLLVVVRGAPRGFPATLTVIAYANGVLLLEALPVCGGLIAIVWFLVVAISGLSEAQRCGHGKATFAVLMPLLLMCVAACATGALLAAFVGGGGSAPPTSTRI